MKSSSKPFKLPPRFRDYHFFGFQFNPKWIIPSGTLEEGDELKFDPNSRNANMAVNIDLALVTTLIVSAVSVCVGVVLFVIELQKVVVTTETSTVSTPMPGVKCYSLRPYGKVVTSANMDIRTIPYKKLLPNANENEKFKQLSFITASHYEGTQDQCTTASETSSMGVKEHVCDAISDMICETDSDVPHQCKNFSAWKNTADFYSYQEYIGHIEFDDDYWWHPSDGIWTSYYDGPFQDWMTNTTMPPRCPGAFIGFSNGSWNLDYFPTYTICKGTVNSHPYIGNKSLEMSSLPSACVPVTHYDVGTPNVVYGLPSTYAVEKVLAADNGMCTNYFCSVRHI